MKGYEATREGGSRPTAGQNGDHEGGHMKGRKTNEGREGGSGSQEQARIAIMHGDKWRGTRRQRQPRAAQNGDHAGRQKKGDKAAAAAKSSPEGRSCKEANEGGQGGSGSQEQPRMEIMQGDKWRETRGQMKGDNAAAAAKSSPEWRSCKETNEGRQGGSGVTTIGVGISYPFFEK